MPRIISKKAVIVLGGIFIFLIGTVAGSFLVLRSSSGEGRTFLISNEESRNGDVARLLGEIQGFGGRNILADEQQFNLTEDFMGAYIQEAISRDVALNELGADEQFIDQAATALKSNRPVLIPAQGSVSVITNESITREAYLSAMDQHFAFLADTWRSITSVTQENIESSEKRAELFGNLRELLASTEQIRKQGTPPEYKNFHETVLRFSLGLYRAGTQGILSITNDPISAVLLIDQLPELEDFGEGMEAEFTRMKQ
jgi:hypothetical protein